MLGPTPTSLGCISASNKRLSHHCISVSRSILCPGHQEPGHQAKGGPFSGINRTWSSSSGLPFKMNQNGFHGVIQVTQNLKRKEGHMRNHRSEECAYRQPDLEWGRTRCQLVATKKTMEKVSAETKGRVRFCRQKARRKERESVLCCGKSSGQSCVASYRSRNLCETVYAFSHTVFYGGREGQKFCASRVCWCAKIMNMKCFVNYQALRLLLRTGE